MRRFSRPIDVLVQVLQKVGREAGNGETWNPVGKQRLHRMLVSLEDGVPRRIRVVVEGRGGGVASVADAIDFPSRAQPHTFRNGR